ncbi:MAG TPA: MerR family transcriptional regulator [Acidimicrobiales bacterium]|nr:MerR family transcriptional regulator [Acidimicrobiales bacterium]
MSTPISRVARDLGISSRTLRYYEERGLVRAQPRDGGSRHYSDDEIARVVRIRELQSVMGFNLDEIAEVLTAEDELAALRAEWTAGQPDDRRSEIVDEAIAINARLQRQVRDKVARLSKFLDELEGNARRYKRIRRTLR